MKIVYPAVFSKDKEGEGYHVYFPDLEGCSASGRDREEALEHAKDAAVDWLMLELADGNDLPAQSHPDDLELEEGETSQYVAMAVKLVEGYD